MDNMVNKVDFVKRIRISGDMVFTLYDLPEEDEGKYLFGNRPVSERNNPYDPLGANLIQADEFALLLKKWRNERFGREHLGNVAITMQDFNTLKHYPARQMATAILQRVYGNDLRAHTLSARRKNEFANKINSDVIEEMIMSASRKGNLQ